MDDPKPVRLTGEAWHAAHPPGTHVGTHAGRRGDSNHRWLGDLVGYDGAHERVKDALIGQPCLHCRSERNVQSALIHGHGSLYSERVRCWYSTDPHDYIPLCASCHKRYDLEVN